MEAKKSAEIGMKRGRLLANLPPPRQLDLIAEGLPILMQSAQDLLSASAVLDAHERAAMVLRGHALEEVAKILILMDIVRCPPTLRGQRIGPMMGWFYDHLARLIYIDAQDWKPTDVAELQGYVDQGRRSHYLEGSVGEYILPNWSIWSRESLLYADVVAYEDGEPTWSAPQAHWSPSTFGPPGPWQVCNALCAVGAFTREGLDVVADVWARVDFRGGQHWADTETLAYEMLVGLQGANLCAEQVCEDDLRALYRRWQLPMYRIEFRRVEVTLESLREQQDGMLAAEGGW